MFSVLRDRMGIPGIISVIALVFAMTGGAYAAKEAAEGSATSSAKKGKAAKGKQGKRGPRGPAGAAGPIGPVGPAGPEGAKGDKGDKGDTGAQGQTGTQGQQGIQGKEGSPWTVDGVLPSEATETGAWGFTSGSQGITSISFAIPLAAALGENNVHLAPEPTNCPGTAASPAADPGHLCVYTGDTSVGGGLVGIMPPDHPDPINGEVSGAARTGALLFYLGSAGTAWGTWAVTGALE